MKLMHCLKMGLLFVGFISSFSFASIARAGERWPEPEKPGNCPVNQRICDYPTYFKPNDAWGIGGFYVDIMTERSSATIRWTATTCDNKPLSGTRDISRGSTGQNYIDFPNKSPFASGVCSFTFSLVGATNGYGGDKVDFKTNYDVDY